MVCTCWDTADNILSSKRLNSSKQPQAPTWQRPTKILPIAWKSNVSSQLNTRTNRPNWWPNAFTDSVFPVPAGPAKQPWNLFTSLSTWKCTKRWSAKASFQSLCHGQVAAISKGCLDETVLHAQIFESVVKTSVCHVDCELLEHLSLSRIEIEAHLAQPLEGLVAGDAIGDEATSYCAFVHKFVYLHIV